MKHLIGIEGLPSQELKEILSLAQRLKKALKAGGNRPILAGKTLAMLFQKPSLRTRVSFQMAMTQLGGQAMYLAPSEVQLGQRESVADVARVLSRYVDAIMARVFAHADLLELASFASVPVINGLSNYEHPCQAVGDLLTIWEKVGGFREVKLSYLGDGNNVIHSLLLAAAKVGMDVAVATPPGYRPNERIVALARQAAQENGGHISLGTDPREAVAGADVIYTDVWISMGQEAQKEERWAVFPPYQVNAELLAHAKATAIVLHCLPAHRGEEITADVLEGPQSVVFDQAENRLHGQKGILAYLLAN